MFRGLHLLALSLLVGPALAGGAWARTWRVEKDGSADFTVIQDAVDAAAPGDTVLVGPGRYDDFQPVEVVGGIVESVAYMTKNDITLRGTDRDAVIVGPVVVPPSNNVHIWVGAHVVGGTGVRVESLTFERTAMGV